MYAFTTLKFSKKKKNIFLRNYKPEKYVGFLAKFAFVTYNNNSTNWSKRANVLKALINSVKRIILDGQRSNMALSVLYFSNNINFIKNTRKQANEPEVGRITHLLGGRKNDFPAWLLSARRV